MLKKLPRVQVTPGTPAIPYQPAQVLCPPPAPPPPWGGPSGYWQLVCETPCVLVGYQTAPEFIGDPGPFPKAIYQCGQPVCRSEWVPNG